MFSPWRLLAAVALLVSACNSNNGFPETGTGTPVPDPPPADSSTSTTTPPTAGTTTDGSTTTPAADSGVTSGVTGGTTQTDTQSGVTPTSDGGTSTDCKDGYNSPDCDCDKNPDNCKRAASIRVARGFQVEMGAPLGVVPQVLLDLRGDLVAAWRGFDGLRHNVWANTYRAGSWGTPVLVESRLEDAGEIHLALDATGDGLLVWDQANGVDHPVWAARYRMGVGWDAPQVISTRGAKVPARTFGARVVVDGAGNAVATWRQFDDEPFARLWSNRYAPGTGWATPKPLEFQ